MNGLDKILIAPTCKRFYDIIKFQKTGLITFKKNEEVKNFTQHNIQKKTFRYRYTQYFNIIELDLTKVWVDLSDIKRILSRFPNLESIKLSFHASNPDLCNILIELSPYTMQVNENLQKVFVQQEFSWLCFRKNEHYVLSKENLQKASNEKYERKKLDIKKSFILLMLIFGIF